VGLDLASKETNPTGFALWDDGYVVTGIVYTDIQILNSTVRAYPDLVAIDAPLTYSEGYREAEKELIRRGIKAFPPNFVKELTWRAIRLKARLGNVIEVFPSAFYKIMGVNENQLDRFVKFESQGRKNNNTQKGKGRKHEPVTLQHPPLLKRYRLPDPQPARCDASVDPTISASFSRFRGFEGFRLRNTGSWSPCGGLLFFVCFSAGVG